ncbi:MAG: hypothetical protein HN509_08575 [Halobacteriovoraceae bacterium]|mgnify:CR=1 FL=1|nr:hypothetical protein [Halobacteriovoraceae bacterium]MBT5095074.1 hypothetical protein [Halobacteriovoraceae bacterium]
MKSLILLLVLIYAAQARSMESTKLPFFNLNGFAKAEERVSVDISFLARNLDNPACYTEIEYGDSTIHHPHVYDISAVTLANYRGHFDLDVDLQTRLFETITRKAPKDSGMTDQEYFLDCRFEINLMQFSSADTILIVRSGELGDNQSVFHVKRGSTRTGDYYWKHISPRLSLWFIIDGME